MRETPAKKRGPYAKTRARRQAIAAATLEIVVERGHGAVSTSSVSERSGLSAKSVVYHFPTRDHLLVAALGAADEVTGKLFVEARLHERSVGEFIASQARTVSGHPNRISLFISQAANARDVDHPASAWFKRHQENARGYFVQALTRDQRAGVAHEDIDPVQFSAQMTALWDGMQMQKLADPSIDLTAAVIDGYRRLARTDLMEARRALALLAADI